MPNLEELLNPETLARYLQQQQQPVPQYVQPQQQTTEYGVPIVYTQPDVSLRGRLELEFVFKANDLAGRTPEQIQQLAMAAVMGQNGPGIPVAKAGYLHIWQEVQQSVAQDKTQSATVSEADRRRIIGEFLAELGRGNPADQTGIRSVSPTGDIGSPGHPVPGVSADQQQPGDRPHRSRGIPDQHPGPEPVADDSEHDDINEPWAGPQPASQPRHRRSRRNATDEPQVPKVELEPEPEFWQVDDDGTTE